MASSRSSAQPVDVHDRVLGADRGDDEIAVPPLELLEHGQELVALGSALRAAQSLLRLAAGELEDGDRLLRPRLRLLAALRDAGEDRLGAGAGVELRIEVHRARDAEQLLAPLLRRRIEQALALGRAGHRRRARR